MFLESQIKQKTDFEKASLEQSRQDFNFMLGNIGSKDKKEKYIVGWLHDLQEDMKKKKLSEMNQQLLKQHELHNSIKLSHHRRELQLELDVANKEKRTLEQSRAAEYLNIKKLKEDRRQEIQRDIDMRHKL